MMMHSCATETARLTTESQRLLLQVTEDHLQIYSIQLVFGSELQGVARMITLVWASMGQC